MSDNEDQYILLTITPLTGSDTNNGCITQELEVTPIMAASHNNWK